MKPLQTLSKEINKRIHACKDCEGVGGKDVVMIDIGGADYPDYDVCTTCQGDGYVIPRKTCNYGCSVKDCKNHNSCSQDKEKYGARCMQCSGTDWVSEDITLQDILLALFNSDCRMFSLRYCLANERLAKGSKYVDIIGLGNEDLVYKIDLTKTPQEWDDETIEEIIKLIK